MKYIFISLMLIAFSCKADKKYKCIQIVYAENAKGEKANKQKDPIYIMASSDQSAYKQAYQLFYNAAKEYSIVKDQAEGIDVPMGFILLDEKGSQISDSIYFAGKRIMEVEITKLTASFLYNPEDSISAIAEDKHIMDSLSHK